MNRFVGNVALPYALAVVICTTVLSWMLVTANPGPLGGAGLLELIVAMLVISLVTNAAFAGVLLLVWPLARRRAEGRVAEHAAIYFASGLLALNVVWCLWNRLSMVHQWASVRPFITWLGLLQSLLLALLAIGLVAGCVGLAVGGKARRGAVVSLLVSVLLAPVLLAWNASNEAFHRHHDLADLKRELSARAPGSPEAGAAEAADGPVILLGVDGMCWSVAGPLLRAGRLPAFERLVARGAIGYLDNADESLSPSIWTTIYTGHSATRHGVEHYEKLVLPRSGRTLPNPLFMKPTTDTFYGLRHLLRYLRSTGAWKIDWIGTADRRVPAVWEVASVFEKQVVVANALVSLPSQPVNGAMVWLLGEPSPGSMYPPELAQAWHPGFDGDHSGRTEESFAGMAGLLQQEVGFTLELFRLHEIDLGIYYSHFLDSISHSNWDFHVGDGFFLTGLPSALDDEEWDRLVGEDRESPVFRAYEEMDRAIERFAGAYPGATFVLVSDHGWTYSGYEHFGSPEGVLVVSGPGVRGGVLEGARIHDITPTLLSLLGIPLSRELEGRPLLEAFANPPAPQQIAAYGDAFRLAGDDLATDVQMDPGEIERLKALGYIQ